MKGEGGQGAYRSRDMHMRTNARLSIILLVILGSTATAASAESFWDGSAAVMLGDSSFESGYYAASNSFPVNTEVTVRNLETGKTTDVIVSRRITEQSNLLVLLSPKAASAIGIPQGRIAAVRVTVKSRPPTEADTLPKDLANSPHPDINPEAGMPTTSTSQPSKEIVPTKQSVPQPVQQIPQQPKPQPVQQIPRQPALQPVQQTPPQPVQQTPQTDLPQQKSLTEVKGKSVAIIGLDSKGMDPGITGIVVDFLLDAFVNVGKMRVVDRSNIDKILQEQSFQTQDIVDNSKVALIGKVSGVEYVVTGSLSKIEQTVYLNIKLISVTTAEIVGSSVALAKGQTDYINLCRDAVGRLFVP
jgi:TolB-like protein